MYLVKNITNVTGKSAKCRFR